MDPINDANAIKNKKTCIPLQQPVIRSVHQHAKQDILQQHSLQQQRRVNKVWNNSTKVKDGLVHRRSQISYEDTCSSKIFTYVRISSHIDCKFVFNQSFLKYFNSAVSENIKQIRMDSGDGRYRIIRTIKEKSATDYRIITHFQKDTVDEISTDKYLEEQWNQFKKLQ